jgi:hypothetical protein
LASCLCVHLRAQSDTSCKIPEPAAGQTKDQQDAAASGALAACKAATAPDALELQTKDEADKKPETDKKNQGASVDDAIDADVLFFPHDQAKWQVDDYLNWIQHEGCPKLYRQAKQNLSQHKSSEKIYLASIVQGVKKQNKCN